MKKAVYTTYNIAAHWLDGGLVLCNNIGEIDESIWDNMRFEQEEDSEIYQYYLTSWTESDVQYLEKTFGLLFTYSEKLDCFVLCVDHWGTMWSGVPCEVKDSTWAEINKELLITADNQFPKYLKEREY